MDYSDTLRYAWNMFYLTVIIFAGWTAAVACMNGKKILWDYDSYPDERAGQDAESHKH